MKIRLGFVTNSSSSSYIIAKHKDCTLDEIKQSLLTNIKKVIEWLESYGAYWDIPIEAEDLINKQDYESAALIVIDDLAKFFYRIGTTELEPWKVDFGVCDSESCGWESFIYEYGYCLSTKNFKVEFEY